MTKHKQNSHSRYHPWHMHTYSNELHQAATQNCKYNCEPYLHCMPLYEAHVCVAALVCCPARKRAPACRGVRATITLAEVSVLSFT